jgi:hypothetical protein
MNAPRGRSGPAAQLSPALRSYKVESAGLVGGVLSLMNASASRIVAKLWSISERAAGVITTL